MHPMLNIAVRAARAAGTIIVRSYGNIDSFDTVAKSQNDYVTSVDKEAELAIVDVIKKSYPDHSFLCEETGEVVGTDKDYLWIIDPLDGTTNFIKGIPHFAISIALKVKGKLEQAVVFDPIRSDLFTASKGAGAQLNGYRIRVGQEKGLSGTLLATGFPFKQKHNTQFYLSTFNSMFVEAADVRRAGSAALDLAYVAAGKLDGYWEMGLQPWDSAAGELLVREAGGMVTDFAGGTSYTDTGDIVAGNPRVVKEMLKAIRPHMPGL